MDATKQARLEAQGWKVGSVDEFLELTPEEGMLIEIKLALASSLRQRRRGQMTQAQLAQKIESSQPRVARAPNRVTCLYPSICSCAPCWQPAPRRKKSGR